MTNREYLEIRSAHRSAVDAYTTASDTVRQLLRPTIIKLADLMASYIAKRPWLAE